MKEECSKLRSHKQCGWAAAGTSTDMSVWACVPADADHWTGSGSGGVPSGGQPLVDRAQLGVYQ